MDEEIVLTDDVLKLIAEALQEAEEIEESDEFLDKFYKIAYR
jgi:hypothetical protein